jgi:hypothetical protein
MQLERRTIDCSERSLLHPERQLLTRSRFLHLDRWHLRGQHVVKLHRRADRLHRPQLTGTNNYGASMANAQVTVKPVTSRRS